MFQTQPVFHKKLPLIKYVSTHIAFGKKGIRKNDLLEEVKKQIFERLLIYL